MTTRRYLSGLVTMGIVAILSAPVPAQTGRTPWGEPDLQGVWTNGTTTPLERPASMGTRTMLTDEEYAERVKVDAGRLVPETEEQLKKPSQGVGQNFWVEPGRTTRATSMVIDPVDGRIPAITPQAKQYLDERQKMMQGLPLTSALWTTQGQWVRCITRGMPGTIPTFYGNNYHIVQSPGYVAITQEMVHETRIIPTDGRPHVSQEIKQWRGDSRGRWDGQTLVVETTNLHASSEFNRSAVLMGSDAKVTERFTRLSATEMDYRVTVEAPSAFTGPFTVSAPMTREGAPNRLEEYACIEGDNAVRLAVRGYLGQKAGEAGGAIHLGGNFIGLR